MDEKDKSTLDEKTTEDESTQEEIADEEVTKETITEKRETLELSPEPQQPKTSTGLEENMAGLLCYLVGLISGIIFLVIEKDNRFVRFHALQSIFISGVLIVLNIFLTAIPVIGWMFSLILAPISFILWIVLMVKAYQGKRFKLPVLGDLVEKKLD